MARPSEQRAERSERSARRLGCPERSAVDVAALNGSRAHAHGQFSPDNRFPGESLPDTSYRTRRAREPITATPTAKTNAAVGSGTGGEDESDSDTKAPILFPSALT